MSMLGFSCTLMVTWEGVLMSVLSLLNLTELLTWVLQTFPSRLHQVG